MTMGASRLPMPQPGRSGFGFALSRGRTNSDIAAYLTVCCQHLGDALRDVRPIAVNVSAEQIFLRADRAVSMGLIVNELVTNALKYAFPDERGGSVNVILHRVGDGKLELAVE